MATPTTQDRQVEQKLRLLKSSIEQADRLADQLWRDKATWRNSRFANGFDELEEIAGSLERARKEISTFNL